MKIYLDDIRGTPDTWHRCYKIEEVMRLLCEAELGGEEITHMSLDHDLGASYLCSKCYEYGDQKEECAESGKNFKDPCDCECHLRPALFPSGYDLVKWMAKHDFWPTNKPIVHSANPAGKVNMRAVIDQFWHPPDPAPSYSIKAVV